MAARETVTKTSMYFYNDFFFFCERDYRDNATVFKVSTSGTTLTVLKLAKVQNRKSYEKLN